MSDNEESKVTGKNRDIFTETKEANHIPLSGAMQQVKGSDLNAAIDEYAAKKKLSAAETNDLTQTLFSALGGQWHNGRYDDIFKHGEEFAQALELNGRTLGIMHPANKLKGGKLKGIEAIRAISSAAGVGKETEVILPRSGIRLNLGVFREKEILNLQIELAERRLDIGRETRGALFSTDDVHLVVSIVDFILRHVTKATVRLPEDNYIEELRKLIKVSDLPALMVGALAGMYPSGYPFIHRCMNPDCGYTTLDPKDHNKTSHLLFKYMYRMDPSKVTPKRFRILGAVWDAHTPDNVIEYQQDVDDTRSIEIDSNEQRFIIEIGTPSYEHHRMYTTAWLSSVMSMVDEALEISDAMNSGDSRTRRANYLTSTINRLTLLRHASWVTCIRIVDGDDNVYEIDETDDIYNALEELCKEEKNISEIYPQIDKARMKSLFGFAGMPVFNCPKCEAEQQVEDPEHPNIIPINITSYFFDIMGYRTLASLR